MGQPSHFVYLFCGGRFKHPNDSRHGIGDRFAELFHRRGTLLRALVSHPLRPGTWQRAPTIINVNNAVHMVGHNYPFVQRYVWAHFWGLQPFRFNNFTVSVQFHFPIFDFPKQTFPALRANGDKIRPGLSIIIIFQSYRLPVVNVGVIFHFWFNQFVGRPQRVAPTGSKTVYSKIRRLVRPLYQREL